jgi:hypothetical protein
MRILLLSVNKCYEGVCYTLTLTSAFVFDNAKDAIFTENLRMANYLKYLADLRDAKITGRAEIRKKGRVRHCLGNEMNNHFYKQACVEGADDIISNGSYAMMKTIKIGGGPDFDNIEKSE